MRVLRPVFFLVTLLISSCAKEGNIVGINPANGIVNIKTDSDTYTWSHGDVIIEGELINNSDQVFYSKVDDYYRTSDKIFFAPHSDGTLEMFSVNDNKWIEINILGRLIEGTVLTEINPNVIYPIYAHLSSKNIDLKNNTVKYRLRIDYYKTETTDKKSVVYCDYSNDFKIIP